MQVRVRDLMTVNPTSVLMGTSLQEAAEQMILAESSEIYVTDLQMRLVGVVPDYEILKHKLMHQNLDAPINSIMNVQIDALSPEDDAIQLAFLFRDRRNSCMAVTENGRLVGKLSCRDVFRVIMALDSIEMAEEQTQGEPTSSMTSAPVPAVSTINPPHLAKSSLRKHFLQQNAPQAK
ncbi:HPP family protein [Gimesia aquarii]|uniref:CBS domain protein n=1 Tax=Gimesia aquarii TaxID=2527964 RepID=A0A517WZC5_9PLAN|nr:CBS domain-containing protein [Gimesia aquarii]QDU10603.1 CBS domain protein [Gimesia aquarii]